MKKSRGVVAGIAVSALAVAGMLVADMLGHVRVGAEYRYELSGTVIAVLVAVSFMLFTWNIVTYRKGK